MKKGGVNSLRYEQLPNRSYSSKIKIVESNSDVELVDRWYVRLLSLFCVPLYGLLKIYDLYRFIKDTFLTVLGGLVNFIIFFFLFGWFWRTRLYKMCKKIPWIRKMIKLNVHYHFLNLFSGACQGYFISLIIPVSPDHQSYLNIASIIIAVVTVLLSIWNRKIHCFCLLLLPIMASRHGRRVVLVMLLTSLLNGPAANMRNNTRLITSQMNCISEKAKNMSDVLTDSVEERYRRLHDHVVEVKDKAKQKMDNIQQNLQELKDKVEKKHAFLLNIARKINKFSDKCEATMKKLNKKCFDAFKKCGKQKKRSANNLQLNYLPPTSHNFTEYNPLRDAFITRISSRSYSYKTSTKFNEPHLPVAGHTNETNPKLTRVTPTTSYRLKSFANSSHPDNYNKTAVPKAPYSNTLDYEINEMTSEDAELEDNTPHHVYYQNKSRYSSHPHSETLHTGKVFHVRTRRNIFQKILCFFKDAFSIVMRPICDIIFNSIAYLCNVPKLVTHFITSIILKKFYYLEETIKKNAWIEIDANMTFDRKIVEVRSAKEAAVELEQRLTNRFSFTPFTIIEIADYLKLISLILVYWKTYGYMSTYKSDSSFDNHYIGRFLIKYDRLAESSIFPMKQSDGAKYIQMGQLTMSPEEYFVATRGSLKAIAFLILIAVMEGGDKMLQFMIHLMHQYGPIRVEHFIDVKDLNKIEAISTNTSRIHLLFDTESCFKEPLAPHSQTAYHFWLGGIILLISLTQIYFLRLRHTLCDSFNPFIRRRRVELLHNKILKSRAYNSKHEAETLFAKVSERNKMQRIFPWLFETACAVCNRNDLLEKCSKCDTMYCLICLRDMDQRCKICEDILFKEKSSQMLDIDND